MTRKAGSTLALIVYTTSHYRTCRSCKENLLLVHKPSRDSVPPPSDSGVPGGVNSSATWSPTARFPREEARAHFSEDFSGG
jgi:hypothetical protein